MPATAGRVKMPANNRMQTSASLNTHSIWQNAIGYDPYAAESSGADAGVNEEAAASARENMKALLALANKNAGGAGVEEKGGWKGRGKLRGGWAGGKDLGEVPKEALLGPRPTAGGAADAEGGRVSVVLGGRWRCRRWKTWWVVRRRSLRFTSERRPKATGPRRRFGAWPLFSKSCEPVCGC